MNKRVKYILIFVCLSLALISAIFAVLKLTKVDDIKINRPSFTKTEPIKKEAAVIKESANIPKTYKVIRVVDGDTIVIFYNDKEEKVRLIGVNTPESVDKRHPVQCFGIEASNYTKNLLTNKNVTIEFDETQAERDKYGRLLLYVYVDDIFVNKNIIENGYGYEYTYIHPYKYKDEFKIAQKHAEENKLGLWADGACKK